MIFLISQSDILVCLGHDDRTGGTYLRNCSCVLHNSVQAENRLMELPEPFNPYNLTKWYFIVQSHFLAQYKKSYVKAHYCHLACQDSILINNIMVDKMLEWPGCLDVLLSDCKSTLILQLAINSVYMQTLYTRYSSSFPCQPSAATVKLLFFFYFVDLIQ